MKKMRSFVAVCLVALAAIVVGDVALTVALLEKRRAQANLSWQLDTATRAYEEANRRASEDSGQLRAQLAAAKDDLATVQLAFPSEVQGTEVLARILGYAQDTGVEISSLQAQPPASEKIGNTSYVVLKFNLQARGELTSIFDFLRRLETGVIKTVKLTNVAVTGSGPGNTLACEVLIYTQPAQK
ncbi:MAG: hypothetical protein AB1566_12330 [Chloroflexota bacterium]